MTEQTNQTDTSERVALAREMFAMLKEHTAPAVPRPVSTGDAAHPLRLSAHEVHELADGAARLIAATAPGAATPRIGGKREGA